MKTLDLDAVQTFALVATLSNFTRVAEASGLTQSAISLKLKRLEDSLDRRLVERTPRSVRLTADGVAFLEHAKVLLAANERALSAASNVAPFRLRLGISDHASGPELPTLLSRLASADPSLMLDVSVGFSRVLLDAYDRGKLDCVIVRREGSRRDGETLTEDEYAWFAAPTFVRDEGAPLRIANLAAPCGVRAIAIRALDGARIRWTEGFVGGGVAAVVAAVNAGIAVAALAWRVAPTGSIDVGAKFKLPALPRAKVQLYSRISTPRAKTALRTLAAAFRGMAGT
ncbi:MAG: LysR family transcriptional regulator [Xanthobacteraceae bacterium]